MNMRLAAQLLTVAGLVALAGCGTTEESPPTTSSPEATQAAPKPKPKTTKGRLKAAIDEAAPGDKVRYVKITGSKGSGYEILVRFDLSDSLTRGLRRKSVENDMRDVYRAVYDGRDGAAIDGVRVEAWTPLIDTRGNEEDGSAFSTSMAPEVGREVNWNNADGLDFNRLWSIDFKLNDF